ncbi:MAG TPA: TetR/AcrR family transcriptional regulator [Ktedonobacterales bacterium]
MSNATHSPSASARHERTRAKREQTLQGARAVFLREGFAGASVEMIAHEAGVSTRTLYSYFSSKEEMFEAVLRSLTIANPRVDMFEFVRAAEPRDANELRALLLTLMARIVPAMMGAEYLTLLRAIIADAHRFPQLGEMLRATIFEDGLMALAGLLQRAQARGLIVPGDPQLMARMLIGPLLTYAILDGVLLPDGQSRPPDPATVHEYVSLTLAALIPSHPITRPRAASVTRETPSSRTGKVVPR